MKLTIVRSALLAVSAAVALTVLQADLAGYAVLGYTWNTGQVVYYVNPQNVYVPQSDAISAIRTASLAWSDQSQANIELVYGGTTGGSSLTLNYKNEVFFRNESGAGGTTYWWADGSGNLVDADIVLRQTDYRFVTDAQACSGAINIRDIATHEFGHALGLNHSAAGDATMYPLMPGYCDTSWRTLTSDDIAGIESLYPPGSSVPAPSGLAVTNSSSSPTTSLVLSWNDNANNETGYRVERSLDGASFAQVGQVGTNVRTYTSSGLAAATTYYYRVYTYNGGGTSGYSNMASGQTTAVASNPPSVSIANPANGAAYPSTAAVTFNGAATDPQDGNLTSGLRWTSTIDGLVGTGGGFSRSLSPGAHVITASVTDTTGLSGASQVSMVVTVAGGPTLTATGAKVKGVPNVWLVWAGFTSTSVDVFRNGTKVMTTANDGSHKDILRKGGGAYTYRVCEAGTGVCSNDVTVAF